MKLTCHIAISLFFLCGCSQQSDLERVLSSAGDNRDELESVLAHYSSDPSDSLKLRAAKFLIGNMSGHCSYSLEEIDDVYCKVDSVYHLDISPEKKMEVADSLIGLYSVEDHIVEDCRIITADFLIKNIDSAYAGWKSQYFNRGISFDDFCDYLLPYKVVEKQALDDWRSILRHKFPTRFSDFTPYNGEYRKFAYYGATVVNDSLRSHLTPRPLNKSYTHPLMLNADIMYSLPYGRCDDFSIIAVALLRSQGFAAALEYVPVWHDQNNGHTFFSIMHGGGKFLPMIWGYESNPGDAFPPDQLCAKVFRYTYSHNKRIEKYQKESRYVYPGFDVFTKDVTSEYMSVSDIAVNIDMTSEFDKYVYIATFNAGGWFIQDFGVRKGKKKAFFRNMGREIAYIVLGFDGKCLVPVSEPFLLHWDGSIEYLTPDHTRLCRVELSRKFPQKDHTIELEHRVIGGKIQASDRKDFKNCKTFYTIDSLSGSLVKEFDNDSAYRYWRFMGPDGGWCNFSELQFFEKGDTTLTPLKGKMIGTLEPYEDNDWWAPEHAFDGDWLTGFHYRDSSGGWIGLDLGYPVCIDRFLCVPRSDDNGVHLGDMYELRYWDKGNWHTAGVQKGKDWTLVYDSIPAGSLLWLRNLTRGQEERIFVYMNGEQVWW